MPEALDDGPSWIACHGAAPAQTNVMGIAASRVSLKALTTPDDCCPVGMKNMTTDILPSYSSKVEPGVPRADSRVISIGTCYTLN